MELNEFISNFAEQFEDTDANVFAPETKFRELEEWSSLTGLAILNMIAKKYGVKVAPAELKSCATIQNVYDLIQSKL